MKRYFYVTPLFWWTATNPIGESYFHNLGMQLFLITSPELWLAFWTHCSTVRVTRSRLLHTAYALCFFVNNSGYVVLL